MELSGAVFLRCCRQLRLPGLERALSVQIIPLLHQCGTSLLSLLHFSHIQPCMYHTYVLSLQGPAVSSAGSVSEMHQRPDRSRSLRVPAFAQLWDLPSLSQRQLPLNVMISSLSPCVQQQWFKTYPNWRETHPFSQESERITFQAPADPRNNEEKLSLSLCPPFPPTFLSSFRPLSAHLTTISQIKSWNFIKHQLCVIFQDRYKEDPTESPCLKGQTSENPRGLVTANTITILIIQQYSYFSPNSVS